MKAKIRLFIQVEFAEGAPITLSKAHQHYLLDVMRCKNNQMIKIFNGTDGEWLAGISMLNKKECAVEVLHKLHEQIYENKLTLAFAPTKNSISYVVQKATELGVTNITPVFTKRTIVTKVNLDKLNIIAIEAAEQCGRMTIPQIHDIMKLQDFIGNNPFSGKLIMCDETGQGSPALNVLQSLNEQDNALLIGPEGGFDEDELRQIKSKSFTISISLGKRILRADTAAIAAIATYQAILDN